MNILKNKEYYKSPEYIAKQRNAKLGNKNYSWKGGVVNHASGYIWEYCPNHPFANNQYVLQHRLVMERYIKRFLYPYEVVHHINENRKDNRIENLQLLSNRGEHNTIHKKCNQNNIK